MNMQIDYEWLEDGGRHYHQDVATRSQEHVPLALHRSIHETFCAACVSSRAPNWRRNDLGKGTIEKCFTTQFTNLWTWFSVSPDGIMLDKLGNWINATWPHNQSDPRHLISSLVELFLPKGHSDESKIYWHITTPVDKHFHARMGFHGRLSSLKSCLQVLNKIANHLIESSFGLSKLDYQTVH